MFKKAERTQAKLKLALMGPSGSGKTKSALRLATGLGKKIAVIDTENGSASLYAEEFDFDVLEIAPPYTVQKYQAAIEAAEKLNYDVIVIDSISHSWAGEGGLLEQKELLDSSGRGNSYTNWSSITKMQEQFKNHILHSPTHIICTMRSKQEYVLQENDKGKQVPKKVGMAPVQRDGIEYEFTVVFDISMNHTAIASKDRTGMFETKMFQITEETGKQLHGWLVKGVAQKPVERPKVSEPPPLNEREQIDSTNALAGAKTETSQTDVGDYIVKFGNKFPGKRLKEIPRDNLKSYIFDYLEKKSIENKKPLEGHALDLFKYGKEYLEKTSTTRQQ